jgi:hypothetical protein
MPDTPCETIHDLDESGNPVGPEWGGPVELDEFAVVPSRDEPVDDEPGPSDCAR